MYYMSSKTWKENKSKQHFTESYLSIFKLLSIHRMVWFEEDHRPSSSSPSYHGQGHLPLDQAHQPPVQLGLEHFKEGGIHHYTGQPVLVPHFSYCLRFRASSTALNWATSISLVQVHSILKVFTITSISVSA